MAQAQQTQAQAGKKDLAAGIYAQIVGNKKIDEKDRRQEFLKRAVSEAGLSASGASTYFANFKNGNWAFTAKPVTKAATATKAATKPKAATATKAAPVTKAAAKKPAKPPVTKPASKKPSTKKAETTTTA